MPKYEMLLRDYHLPVPRHDGVADRLVGLGGLVSSWAPACLFLVLSSGRFFSGDFSRRGRWSSAPLRAPARRALVVSARRPRPGAAPGPWATPATSSPTRWTPASGLDMALAEAATVRNNVIFESRLAPLVEEPCRRLAHGGWRLAPAGMPDLMVGMLTTAKGRGTTPSKFFRFLARYYETRFSRSATLLRGAIRAGDGDRVSACSLPSSALSIFQTHDRVDR